MRGEISFRNVALRSKLQILLLGISILPLFIIIFFLNPFARDRYYNQAKVDLANETDRIAGLVEESYLLLRNDLFTKPKYNPRLKEFQQSIEEYGRVLDTDINVFDEDGRLIATTQPQIFDLGITSRLMHSEAYRNLSGGNSNEIVIDERIGNLKYFSSYKPIISSRPVGFINVPYLAKQDKLDEQRLNFFSYLVNIYLIVFLLIGFFAVLASNAITQPLSLIEQKLAQTKLGDVNDPLEYNSDDEIGAIVTAYNDMVGKFTESQRKLARTEREMAWRQMARQVAHEIKNPLTPMKLSIQHLNRAHKSKHAKFEGLFPKVMNTLMVQIESLVNIANSFSEFAKMPEPKRSRFILQEVLYEVIDLYQQSEDAELYVDIPDDDFWIVADRDQLSRVFNNVIKNGLQAIEENGIINVSLRINGKEACVEIADNGSGIPVEVQSKIFQPNFSTKSSGMGLGLAIVKKIVENSGGTIYFKSTPGEGTTFYIKLPEADSV